MASALDLEDKRMPNYKISKPSSIRHTVEFTDEEVFEALLKYASEKGITLATGKGYLWGLDNHEPGTAITLVIDEPISEGETP